MTGSKEYKGRIDDYTIVSYADGRCVWGTFLDHPQFAGRYGHTSMIVNEEDLDTGYIAIETLNSRYLLLNEKHTN